MEAESAMPAEDPHRFEQEDTMEEEYSFDELAQGLASGALSRGRTLKLVSAAILGGTLTALCFGPKILKK
jgi:hypothetical protein